MGNARIKRTLAAAALVLTALAATADSAQGLDRLTPFAGTWKSVGQNVDTIYSKAGDISSTLVNQCWKTGSFFVCNQSVNGASRVMLVFAYIGGDSFSVTYVPADGSRAINGKLIVDGGVWTYPGEQNKLGETTYFRTVDIFSNSDNIDFREEFSTDNEHWTLMSSGHQTRVRN